MKKITLQDQKEVYTNVIKSLAKERDKWEFLAKHPLPEGWLYPDQHPRIGEIISLNPELYNQIFK